LGDDGISLKPKRITRNKNYINVDLQKMHGTENLRYINVVVGDVLFAVRVSQRDIMNKDSMFLPALTCRKSALFQYGAFLCVLYDFYKQP
jgi:hypothetical protein